MRMCGTPEVKVRDFQEVLSFRALVLTTFETSKKTRTERELSARVFPGVEYRSFSSFTTNFRFPHRSKNIATSLVYNRWTIPPRKSINPFPQQVGKKEFKMLILYFTVKYFSHPTVPSFLYCFDVPSVHLIITLTSYLAVLITYSTTVSKFRQEVTVSDPGSSQSKCTQCSSKIYPPHHLFQQ